MVSVDGRCVINPMEDEEETTQENIDERYDLVAVGPLIDPALNTF